MCLFLPLTGALDVQKTNVIFIMYDDLRTELGAYGRKHMITPNFDRLAAKSVVFDKAYCQIAVCNPSRDSMLTGLRPDTVGTYAFQSSFRPHMSLNSHIAQAGYNTAGYGKISHWEWDDKKEWSFEQWDNQWYQYQQTELAFMNASTMPDKTRPEHSFRDWQFATKAISGLKRMATDASGKYFMLAVGFKLPHLAVHLPYKYFEMYVFCSIVLPSFLVCDVSVSLIHLLQRACIL
jgi:arylsulfatase A-like enzyme